MFLPPPLKGFLCAEEIKAPPCPRSPSSVCSCDGLLRETGTLAAGIGRLPPDRGHGCRCWLCRRRLPGLVSGSQRSPLWDPEGLRFIKRGGSRRSDGEGHVCPGGSVSCPALTKQVHKRRVNFQPVLDAGFSKGAESLGDTRDHSRPKTWGGLVSPNTPHSALSGKSVIDVRPTCTLRLVTPIT